MRRRKRDKVFENRLKGSHICLTEADGVHILKNTGCAAGGRRR